MRLFSARDTPCNKCPSVLETCGPQLLVVRRPYFIPLLPFIAECLLRSENVTILSFLHRVFKAYLE